MAIFMAVGPWMLGWSIFVFGTLIAAALRRNYEAGLLLVPLGFTSGRYRRWRHWQRNQRRARLAIYFTAHNASRPLSPFTYPPSTPLMRAFSSLCSSSSSAICACSATRSTPPTSLPPRAQRRRKLLIPQEKLDTPGYEVDSVYQPANEVGGDFFHVQTMGSQGLLVVIKATLRATNSKPQ